MLTEEKLYSYYDDNAQKLHGLVDRIVARFGGISGEDMDDFYSLANEVFTEVLKRYDEEQPFDGFLYSCLLNRIKTEMTKRNSYKRRADRMSVSIYLPIGDDETITLGDMILADIDIEKEVLDDGMIQDERIKRYLGSLSEIQRRILELKMQNVKVQYIKQYLGLTNKQYLSHMREMMKYEHIRLLGR